MKRLGIENGKDVFYLLLTILVSLFTTLVLAGAVWNVATGEMLYTALAYIPIRLYVQFPYLLALCVLVMYMGMATWIFMGVASIFYKPKPDLKANSEDKLISIIIPACNEAEVIKNLLFDLLAQSYKNFEILVIAHNCQDDTAQRAREIGDERVKVIEYFTRQSGKALALNRGLRETEGEIVAQFDADNRIKDTDFLRRAVVYFENPKTTGIQARLVTSNSKSSWLSLLQEVEYDAFSVISWTGRAALKVPCFLAGTGGVFRKTDLLEIGGWRNYLVEDFELFTRLSLKKKKIHYADNLVVYDEKPITWVALFRQRTRWVKGHLQVTWENLANFGNPIDYFYRLSPISVFAWWISTLLYLFYFLTGQLLIWEVGNLLWVSWTAVFQVLLVYALWRKGGFKKVALSPLYWFFGFHWVWVTLLSLRVKSWAQTKTVHVGDFFH